MKIGIAVTVHNRNEVALKTLSILRAWLPDNAVLVCVDDASIMPFGFANYRFDKNVGVAKAKNKCLELLHDAGCTHFFLFDDDLYPVADNWWKPYVNSGLNHACWNYNRAVIKFGIQATASLPEYEPVLREYVELDKPNGCMLYVRRGVIDTVGGWDADFTGYGYDHVNWSDRIFNNVLTPARYIDIPNSKGLFKMADCESSFSSADRAQIPANFKLYQEKYYSKEFKPFK